MLPSIFLSRAINPVSILMDTLSRIVVARCLVCEPYKPDNYEACDFCSRTIRDLIDVLSGMGKV